MDVPVGADGVFVPRLACTRPSAELSADEGCFADIGGSLGQSPPHDGNTSWLGDEGDVFADGPASNDWARRRKLKKRISQISSRNEVSERLGEREREVGREGKGERKRKRERERESVGGRKRREREREREGRGRGEGEGEREREGRGGGREGETLR